ncbi:plasmid mobilization protein [Ferrovum sp.]|uniref:plasmid mobilization protein n=1 Tax=Ferrovum sp. TaxID=2609467 RepID=UPI00261ECD66|nr:hypothetical protein [Ferrovum sp.]
MATATERIPVLVTATEKGKIAKKAKEAGVSMGEFLRRAASSYCPSEEASMLVGMLDQMNKTTAQANAAIDGALAFVEASNQRITAMEQKAVIKRKAA